MLHDIELFMPTLFPVVLESKTAAVLADLDLAAFSGFAHDDLTMAARRIGESARALLPAGDAVTGTKLAVLYQVVHDELLLDGLQRDRRHVGARPVEE